MKTKIIIGTIFFLLLILAGCTSKENENEANENDITNEVDSIIIGDEEIEIGEMIATEQNINESIEDEIIDENEEVEIGEMI